MCMLYANHDGRLSDSLLANKATSYKEKFFSSGDGRTMLGDH